MSNDLVQQLRVVERDGPTGLICGICKEAADRIEALEAALTEIATHWAPSVNNWVVKFKSIAIQALEGK